jgi:hypothetical protein
MRSQPRNAVGFATQFGIILSNCILNLYYRLETAKYPDKAEKTKHLPLLSASNGKLILER